MHCTHYDRELAMTQMYMDALEQTNKEFEANFDGDEEEEQVKACVC
jgi:hypothetical protein